MVPGAVQPAETLPADKALAQALEALANPTRVTLLRCLRTPRTLGEIEVLTEEDGPPRTLSRQAVKVHVERLLALGILVARSTVRNRGPTTEYTLNHQALYALAEEFRDLARLRPSAEPEAPTFVGTKPAPEPSPQGPCLVQVRGLEEGKAYDLRPPASGTKSWTFGRRRGLEVSLDFDPFVSTEHARVRWENGGHVLEDLPDSRNGTFLNFQELPKGTRRVLRTGDLVGVGRTLLMFRG